MSHEELMNLAAIPQAGKRIIAILDEQIEQYRLITAPKISDDMIEGFPKAGVGRSFFRSDRCCKKHVCRVN